MNRMDGSMTVMTLLYSLNCLSLFDMSCGVRDTNGFKFLSILWTVYFYLIGVVGSCSKYSIIKQLYVIWLIDWLMFNGSIFGYIVQHRLRSNLCFHNWINFCGYNTLFFSCFPLKHLIFSLFSLLSSSFFLYFLF